MYVMGAIAREIIAQLRRSGIDPAPVCTAANVELRALAEGGASISMSEYVRLVRHTLEISGDPAFGLHLGENASTGALSVVGFLLVNCRTLREATECFLRYASLVADGPRWRMVEDSAIARFIFDDVRTDPVASRVSAEICLTIALKVGAQLVHSPGCLRETRFAHEPQGYVEEYTRIFGPDVRFGQRFDELVFDAALLDVENLQHDRPLRTLLGERAEELLRRARSPGRLPERVRDMVRCTQDLGRVDARSLARQLGLTPRSLGRRLREHGLSLSGLLQETKREIACDMLCDADASIKETAHTLGFSEPSAFHRAFKRWTGVTPRQYRAVRRAPS